MAKTTDLVMTRSFAVDLERAWQAWVDPVQVVRWWGPDGFTAPSAAIDFRVGGTSLVCMRAPAAFGGRDLYNTWAYTQIEPGVSFRFVQNLTDSNGVPIDPRSVGVRGDLPRDMRCSVEFSDAGGGTTTVVVTQYDWVEGPMFDLAVRGLEQCLAKMELSFTDP